MAWVKSTVGLQPEIPPSSLAKMKRLDPDTLPFETGNSPVPLKTMPVGAAIVPPPAGGMITTRGWPTGAGFPEPSYSVLTPVALSATQRNVGCATARPQGLTKFGSVTGARPGMSDTRFVCQ